MTIKLTVEIEADVDPRIHEGSAAQLCDMEESVVHAVKEALKATEDRGYNHPLEGYMTLEMTGVSVQAHQPPGPLRKWSAINRQDGNKSFVVSGTSPQEAALAALSQLGWGLSDGDAPYEAQAPCPPRKTGVLISTHGEVTFDADTGDVLEVERYTSGDELDIARVDVAEWKRTYPGEHIAASHDILDFGTWDRNGVYDGPSLEWRRERLASLEGGGT